MGFFDGFDFTGSKARSDMRRANKQATGALAEGYGQQSQRYDQAYGLYDPYAAEGRQGAEMYNALLGLRGGDAAQSSYDTLAGLPAFSGKFAQESNAVLRNMNARGQGAGGAAALAGERVLQQNIGNWLDRYRDAGRQGYEATGQQAGIRMNQGDNAMGYGATRANQAIGYGNAMAGTRNAGLNNLLNIAGTAISGVNAFRKPTGV